MTVARFTEDEVAERAGTTPERIGRFAELGILEPEGGTYPRRDVLRARFLAGLDAMAGGRRPPRSDRTFAQLS